ncbi:MAG: EamA family transporter RarD [Pseudomonadota bacterium]
MNDARAGVIAMVAVCAIWGVSPLYYGLLDHVPPFEVMCHRAIWTLVLFLPVLAAQGRLGDLRALLADRAQRAPLLVASLAISANWFLFIFATAIGRVTDSSLGYYIFPLASVAAGAMFLGERLNGARALAVALAGLAVGLLAFGLGNLPWISLGLAITMVIYGLMKRVIKTPSAVSVAGEAVWIAPICLAWLVLFGSGGHDLATWALLAGAGPLTALPLMMFTFAATRITMATQGFLMYLNPTLQGALALFVLAEPMSPWHGLAFPLIWVALAVYSADAFAAERRIRRSAANASGSGTSVM